MELRKIEKLMNEWDKLIDTMNDEEFNTWNVFMAINHVASELQGLDCLMNMTFSNCVITQGICVITDWKPGAVVFQSDNGDIPKMRIVFPEEYVEFMKKVEPLFDVEYPEFPKEQE